MGHTRFQGAPGSFAEVAPLVSPVCWKPANDPDVFASESDPSSISIGDDLIATLRAGVPIALPKCGLHFTYTDAAAADFAGVVHVYGRNHLGVKIDEVVSVIVGGTPKPTGRAYTVIERMIVETWENAQAADTLEIGFNMGAGTNGTTTRLRLGFPNAYSSAGDWLAMYQVSPSSAMLPVVPQQVNYARGTFTVDSTATAGEGFVFIPNPENPDI